MLSLVLVSYLKKTGSKRKEEKKTSALNFLFLRKKKNENLAMLEQKSVLPDSI